MLETNIIKFKIKLTKYFKLKIMPANVTNRNKNLYSTPGALK